VEENRKRKRSVEGETVDVEISSGEKFRNYIEKMRALDAAQELLKQQITAEDLDAVRALLDEHAEKNLANEALYAGEKMGLYLPLEYAVKFAPVQSRASLVRLLLEKKADVNASKKKSPLQLAAQEGDTATVAILLTAKADVNLKKGDLDTWSSQSPLEFAAYYGHVEVVKLLLEAKASDEENSCVISSEVWRNVSRDSVISRRIAQKLLDAKASLIRGGVGGYSISKQQISSMPRNMSQALDKAGAKMHTSTLGEQYGVVSQEVLKRAADELQKTEAYNREKIVTLLLEAKATHAGEDCYLISQQALNEAVERGGMPEETVQTLLWAKASYGGRGYSMSRAALFNAAKQGHLSVVKELLEKSTVKIDDVDGLGATALMRGVEGPKAAEVAALLLEYKANPNAATFITPLHIAACDMYMSESQAINVMNVLLKAKAEVDSPMRNTEFYRGDDRNIGKTPLYVAARDKRGDVMKFLLEQKADIELAVKKATDANEFDIIAMLRGAVTKHETSAPLTSRDQSVPMSSFGAVTFNFSSSLAPVTTASPASQPKEEEASYTGSTLSYRPSEQNED